MGLLNRKRHQFSTFQIILSGFAAVILAGTILLMLPVSSAGGRAASLDEALFTATSAVCVTGLVVRDTATGWSVFGQAVILILIQIGGLGVITVASAIMFLSGKKVSLKQRGMLQEALSAPNIGGIVKLTRFILKCVFCIELAGALLMMPVFCRDYGLKGIWMSVFHSVSAFCNAGFDICGSAGAEYVSLTGYAGNLLINIVIMLLIIIGGIGFLTWDDVVRHRNHISVYSMQSKTILLMTAILITVPACYFYICEFASLPEGERVMASLFQAVTPRTAGFNTEDIASLSGTGQALTIVLMLIGGAPGSAAGGMKVTTFAVMAASAIAVFRQRDSAELFGRRLDPDAVRNASALFLMYMLLFVGGAFLISMADKLPMGSCLFEAASAVGTVGLTTGITPGLGIFSRMVLIGLMYLGRVGGLTFIYAAFPVRPKDGARLPLEKIMVG